MKEKTSNNKVESFLSWVGLFTAVPADLLAIIPALVNLLKTLGILEGEQANIPPVVFLNGIAIPVKAITFALIFYGYVASCFWFLRKIKSPRSRQDRYLGIKGLSTGIFSIFGIPFVLSFVTFGMFELNKGLAIASILIIVSAVIWTQWRFHESYHYKDVGIAYLLWIPLAAMFLAFDPKIFWWWSLLVAWFYSSLGYILSLAVVIAMLTFLRSFFREWGEGSFMDNLSDAAEKGITFSFDKGILFFVLLLLTIAITIISGYISIGFWISTSIMFRAIWIATPFILVLGAWLILKR